jgi:hypothetical protein
MNPEIKNACSAIAIQMLRPQESHPSWVYCTLESQSIRRGTLYYNCEGTRDKETSKKQMENS